MSRRYSDCLQYYCPSDAIETILRVTGERVCLFVRPALLWLEQEEEEGEEGEGEGEGERKQSFHFG